MIVGIEVFNRHFEVYLFKQNGSELIERFNSLKAAKRCVKLTKKGLYYKNLCR